MHRLSLLAVAAALASALPAAADEVLLEKVQVTANRQAEGQYAVPQPVTVLDAADIAKQTPQVMAELLRGAPGAYFQQTGAGQGIAIIRGLKGAEVLHLVDGFRLNDAFFRTAPSQYIALVDSYNIAQLEVLRGPYATLYGPDAMGGVLQVLTPEEKFAAGEPQTHSKLMVGYSTPDEGFVGRVSHAVGTDKLSVSGGFSYTSYGSRDVGGVAQSANGRGGVFISDKAAPTAYTARGYDVKTLWKPAEGQQLLLSASYFDLPNLPRYNEVVNGFGASPAVAQSVYFNNRAFYHLRYTLEAPLPFISRIELHLGRQVVNDDRYDLSLDLATNTFEGNRSTLDGFTAQAISALGARNTLTYGLELYRNRVRSNKQVVIGGNTTVSGPGSPNSVKARFPDNSHSNNFGVYLSDEWKPTERLVVDVGGRYNQTKSVLAKADRLSGGEVESDDVTGSLGLLYKLTPALAVTGNVGKGFRAPNINDLAQTGRRSGNPPRITTANTALKPETVVSGDLGLKWAQRRLQAELSVFYSDYSDRISTQPTGRRIAPGSEGCPSGNTACVEVQNVNIAKANYYGIESGLRYRLSSKLAAHASLNYTYGEQQILGVTSPGNRVPPINGLVGVEYRPLPTLEIEPSLLFNGTQDRLDATDLADNRINPQGTGGFAVFNIRSTWQPNDTWRVQLTGENLLDKDYREHGSGINGKGRGASLSVQLDLK